MAIFFFPGMETGRVWRPSADIYRTCEGWLVKLDLAGVCPEDVTIAAQGTRIIVSGVRRDRIVEEGWSHYAMEITYSRFERVIELPLDVERAEVNAEYRDGMLLVFIRPHERQRENEETGHE